MFGAVPDGPECRDTMLPVINLTQINKISISLDRGISWELVRTEDPHQQSTKLKTIQYSIRDAQNNNDFEKTCIPDDSGPYQRYTKLKISAPLHSDSLWLSHKIHVSKVENLKTNR